MSNSADVKSLKALLLKVTALSKDYAPVVSEVKNQVNKTLSTLVAEDPSKKGFQEDMQKAIKLAESGNAAAAKEILRSNGYNKEI
jgi:soluble cytochrome b562